MSENVICYIMINEIIFLMVKGPRLFLLMSLLSDIILRESLELLATLDFCFSLREVS